MAGVSALTDDLRPVRAKDIGLFIPATCGNGHPLTDGNYRIYRVRPRKDRPGSKTTWRWKCNDCTHAYNGRRPTTDRARLLSPKDRRDPVLCIAMKHGLDRIQGEDAVEWLRVTFRALSPEDVRAFGFLDFDGMEDAA